MNQERTGETPLLLKHLDAYQKNPKSRNFAPLAESYRKLGMYDDALRVLRDGIKNHPTYILGYIILAHVYFDQEKYEAAYGSVVSLVKENLDNLGLQKIYAETCLKIHRYEEALETFKYVLFLNPKDAHAEEQIKLLEDEMYKEQLNVLNYQNQRNEELKATLEEKFRTLPSKADNSEDQWSLVNFSKNETKVESAAKDLESAAESLDDWSMNSGPLPPAENNVLDFESSIKEEDLDITPLITLTLVDLYWSQKHYDKAKELLEKFLEHNPNDKQLLDKLKLLEDEIKEERKGQIVLVKEEQGHQELMDIFEKKVNNKHRKIEKLESLFRLFAQGIHVRAKEILR